jgi:SAM-dependent methyltransferase
VSAAEIIGAAEQRQAEQADQATALEDLRQLSLADFGELFFSLPDRRYPQLSAVLPRMASEDVQLRWTGATGANLLAQTRTFVQAVAQHFEAATGQPLRGRRVLDFGCGYGRILRLMSYYIDPQHLYGCDPSPTPIKLCREAGILGNLAVSDYLPRTLPFDVSFDLVYAYSVFTHLSERATKACLDTIAGYLTPSGILVVTIRPPEYWQHDPEIRKADLVDTMVAQHTESGFAFAPHKRAAVDGDVTYGDTSMSLDYLRDKFPAYRVLYAEPAADRLQTIVVLQLAPPPAPAAPPPTLIQRLRRLIRR